MADTKPKAPSQSEEMYVAYVHGESIQSIAARLKVEVETVLAAIAGAEAARAKK